ncbi:hypothetical protein BCR15_11495 [Tessaracoccus lapidicaptus]|uniref:Sortase n=1 Tax=Tessaracoccus lapidicaptus TaxID=1427523 RepID=A0A1C0ARU4_9ACTN|nr:class C sortase [Tessaracoccus lapidicaptus]OCL37087.1 hypothetical protein BCR15_11495 [Tessaracoccus lapidicaptus]
MAAGAFLLSAPVAESIRTDIMVMQQVTTYTTQVEAQPAAERAADLAAADAYNAALPPALLLDPWGDRAPDPDAAHAEYLQQLAGAPAMGRIRIPAIDVDLPILHDATRAQLDAGVGHMFGTSLPVGGAGTHAVLAGHTGLRSAPMFDELDELTGADLIHIDVAGETLTYRVDSLDLVAPDDIGAVAPVPGADLITLVTCRGYPGWTHRLLVRAVRVVEAPPADALVTSSTASTVHTTLLILAHLTETPDRQLRLALSVGAVALAVAMILSWIVTDLRHHRRRP